MINLSKITKEGKAFFLAYDQGMEHGPADFDDENVNPQYVLNFTKSNLYTGIIFQKGIAEKYYSNTEFTQIVPLILKLNGKTNLTNNPNPYSPQICTPKEALELGASAVGYTIYVGSAYESQMFREFGKIVEEAHELNIPVIGWMYVRGTEAELRNRDEMTSYASRIGLEMGADMIKIKYPGDEKSLRWAVESAGKTKVVLSGGERKSEEIFLEMTETAMKSGCIGMAVGRNIWQSENPIDLSQKIHDIIWR